MPTFRQYFKPNDETNEARSVEAKEDAATFLIGVAFGPKIDRYIVSKASITTVSYEVKNYSYLSSGIENNFIRSSGEMTSFFPRAKERIVVELGSKLILQ